MSGLLANVMVFGALMKPPGTLNIPNSHTLNQVDKIDSKIIKQVKDDKTSANYTRISANQEGEIGTVVLNGDRTPDSKSLSPSRNVFLNAIDNLGISLIWTNRVYLCILPMFLCNGPAYSVTVIYIKERALQAGVSEIQSALLISVIGLSGLVARAGHGHLIDKKIIHPAKMFCFANFLAGIAAPFIAISEHYAMFLLCATCVGFGAGLYIALNIYLVRHIVGVHRFPGGIGLGLMLVSVSIMTSVALAGKSEVFKIWVMTQIWVGTRNGCKFWLWTFS